MSEDIEVFSAHLTSDDVDLVAYQVSGFRGHESISQPFAFTVEAVVTGGGNVSLDDLEGAAVSLHVRGRGRDRTVHGMVTAIEVARDPQAGVDQVTLELGPRLWRSSLVTMQEVFLESSVPDIVAAKLERVDLARDTDVWFELSEEDAVRPFVVQWRERDLDFIQRLCEHRGISYHFVHRDRDEVHFVDDVGAFPELGHVLPVRESGTEEGVFALVRRRVPQPAFFTASDYNPDHPEIPVRGEYRLARGFAGACVDYGPHVGTPAEATKVAQRRGEECGTRRDVVRGDSNVLGVAAGVRARLEHADRDPERILFTEVFHEASLSALLQGAGDRRPSYRCRFSAVPATAPYRPPRRTPRPSIPGLLHGTIVNGPTGIERYAKLDEQGRYWVRLMLDPAPHPSRPSVASRFLQAHAGPGYGIHFPLKPGVEVLLGFENGDPDRPVIVGAAPNARTPSPVTARIGTQNRIVTRSGITMDFEDGQGAEPL
ncbi:MAG: type VI secretion system tip protein TssI/VgrG [Myxococcota bacterium]